MKLNEFLSLTEAGLFERINSITPLPLQLDSKMLDFQFLLLHGNKTVSSSIVEMLETKTPEYVMNMLATIHSGNFSHKWDIQANLLKMDSIGVQKQVKEAIKDNNRARQNSNITDKISAYDSNDFVNDSNQENILNTRERNAKTRVLTETTTNTSQVNSLINTLQRQQMYIIMFTDIIELLCLQIY